MAEQMKLTLAGTTIEFSPLLTPEYDRPDDRDRKPFVASDGGRWYYDFGTKQDHVISLNNVSKTDADQINTWWVNRSVPVFTPDLQGAPGTTIFVQILGEQRPIQMWYPSGWQEEYKGTLLLHEVSSSSNSISSSSAGSSSSPSSSSTTSPSSSSSGESSSSISYNPTAS